MAYQYDQYDYEDAYEWEPPAEKVHTYGSPVSARGYRDPQVLADPSSLGYDDDYLSPVPSRRNKPYGAVNPNFAYPAAQAQAHPRTHSVFVSEPEVVREQYCICSPKTDFERRLLVTVVVLSVVCLALLATLGGFMPSIMCGKACAAENGGGGSLADIFPFMGTRLEAMLPG